MTEPKKAAVKERARAVVDPETAKDWLEDWAEAMDIDTDVNSKLLDEEDAAMLKELLARVQKGIERGHVTFTDDQELIYTPWRKKSKMFGEPLTFHERTGGDMMVLDRKKKNSDMEKTYTLIAKLCKVQPKDILGLVGPDLKLVESVFKLLMG